MTKDQLVSLLVCIGTYAPAWSVEENKELLTKALNEGVRNLVTEFDTYKDQQAELTDRQNELLANAYGLITDLRDDKEKLCGRIKNLEETIAAYQASEQDSQDSIVSDTTDDTGMPTYAEHTDEIDPREAKRVEAVDQLCKRLGIKAENALWHALQCNQDGDRFSVFFGNDMYGNSQSKNPECYNFLGNLQEFCRKRNVRAFFQRDHLTIIVQARVRR